MIGRWWESWLMWPLNVGGMRSPRFNFCIDFRVDSVPRNSLTSVEPRYCKNGTNFFSTSEVVLIDRLSRLTLTFSYRTELDTSLFAVWRHWVFKPVGTPSKSSDGARISKFVDKFGGCGAGLELKKVVEHHHPASSVTELTDFFHDSSSARWFADSVPLVESCFRPSYSSCRIYRLRPVPKCDFFFRLSFCTLAVQPSAAFVYDGQFCGSRSPFAIQFPIFDRCDPCPWSGGD